MPSGALNPEWLLKDGLQYVAESKNKYSRTFQKVYNNDDSIEYIQFKLIIW